MFSSAKKREQELAREQELVRQTEKVAVLTQSAGNIHAYNDEAMNIFAELEVDKSDFEKAAAQVNDYITEIRQGEEERFDREQLLFDIIKGMAEGQTETEAQYQVLVEAVKNQKEQLGNIAESNQQIAEPLKTAGQNTTEAGQDILHMKEQLQQMQELGRQMGVLSLNAAIEAGRMGEEGRQFVSASQEVCDLANIYQKAAEDLNIQIEEMKTKLSEAQEKMEQLTALFEENHNSVERTLENVQETMIPIEEKPMPAWAVVSNNLVEGFQMAAASTADHEQYFEQALQCMEQVGQIYSNEQQSVERLKEHWKQVQEEAEKSMQE